MESNATRLRKMGGRLTNKDMDQLEQWIGTGPKSFTLLYAITRDGCNATTFHQKCDNQGATVTVLYNPHGSVYGGYTSESWANNGGYRDDADAFLYQLYYSKNPQCTKFPYNYDGNATYTAGFGPTFGSNHDLETFQGTIKKTQHFFALNGYMSIGGSYDSQGISVNQINNGTMNVTELEVYRVADGQRRIVPNKPWRKTKRWNKRFLHELTEDIVSFKPIPNLDVTEARILMIGPVGAGKSSFYNTINSIFRGRITQRANSGSAEQSLTTAYTPYFVRERSGANQNFLLCDTRGLEEAQGLDVLECNYLLEGNVPEYYQFNPASPISEDTDGFVRNPTPNDKVHCVVFVMDSTTLEVLPTKIIQKMKSFQSLMNQKGIPQALLLTKIDKLCKDVQNDVSQVFRSKTVEEHVEKASQLLGLPRGNVLPVKNYENEMQLEDTISILALLTLRQILYFTQDYMENMMDKMAVVRRKMEKVNVKN
ncbi:interferon-induced protein 44-like [Mercenaria mercenaria]|uniref:interferon-induced protein 44-like n=1 Tax=Mercenaria mercenaria TaxID=6596 RepID=UPI00234F7BFA|nr:interferon-induced protein 44-like [Mercenaria mercenaria]